MHSTSRQAPYLQLLVFLPVLIQNEQQLLGTAQGEYGNQTGAAARHDALHSCGELLLATLSVTRK